MKIPHQFNLAGATWTVSQVDKIGDTDYLGLTTRDKLLIEIKKGLPQTVKEITYLHEVGHAIKYTQGLDSHDEVEIDSWAQLMHQVLITSK